jgi:hypothetical protein
MIYNHRAFLRNLPLATDLMREFLAEHVFDTQAVDWSAEEPTLAEALADAIESHPDTSVRDELIAAIEQVAQLADGAGTRQMLTVCSTDPKITAAFETLESPEERALWLYVNSPAKFNEAVLARLFDDGLTRGSSQCWTLPPFPALQLDETAQKAVSSTVAAYYLKKFGYGHHHKPYVVTRHIEGSILVVIDLSDHACNRARWEKGDLRRGPLILSRTLVLNYQLATGRTETVAPGGAAAQQTLVDAFAKHGLKIKEQAKQIFPACYQLDSLRNGVDIFDRESLGIEQPRLKAISVYRPDDGLCSEFSVKGRESRASVETLVKSSYPTDRPLDRNWPIVGATIELPFYPEASKGGDKKKSLRLRFNRKGQANLHKFTEGERKLIEPLLVEWGLVPAPKVASPAPAEPVQQ